MTSFSLLDKQGYHTCHQLAQMTSSVVCPYESQSVTSPLTYGIEIECPWSSYFPELWAQYCLDQRKISALTTHELEQLSADCKILETTLLPKLHATVSCGVPRGNDRYWEFSLRPVHDVRLLAEQVRLLTAADVLPRDKKHSLHVTVGGLTPSKSVYYLAMLLELAYVDPQRLVHGIGLKRQPIHTGWARKGLAGVVLKTAADLEAGATQAIELRTLQLPQSHDGVIQLLDTVAWITRAIHERQCKMNTVYTQRWGDVEHIISESLKQVDLPDVNWGRLQGDAHFEVWTHFTQHYEQLSHLVSECYASPVPDDNTPSP